MDSPWDRNFVFSQRQLFREVSELLKSKDTQKQLGATLSEGASHFVHFFNARPTATASANDGCTHTIQSIQYGDRQRGILTSKKVIITERVHCALPCAELTQLSGRTDRSGGRPFAFGNYEALGCSRLGTI